ncbi:MAG: hypothetical protein K9G58_03090 [Bacteroidales bacterium]|nr:hypothetical protein [Bacteroidales bacterium]MCF8386416.1 hypothetical protein [Bacteroidales bacterium]MCF8397126.1 hypothetical protein [Bacteroidales bacterium]
MKKIEFILITATLAIFYNNCLAQSNSKFDQTILNAGFGISNRGLPVFASIEYGLTEDINLGGEILYSHFKEDIEDLNWEHNAFVFSAIVNYYFDRVLNLQNDYDLHAGLSAGFDMISTKEKNKKYNPEYDGDYTSALFYSFRIGGRYFFNRNMAVKSQFEIGKLIALRFGVSWLF